MGKEIENCGSSPGLIALSVTFSITTMYNKIHIRVKNSFVSKVHFLRQLQAL